MSWHCSVGFVCLFLTVLSLTSDMCNSSEGKVVITRDFQGEPCNDAQATSKVYSTSNILLSSESVFLVESTVKCSNNPKNLFLYAEINGNLHPVSKSSDNTVHQFSWVAKHAKAKSGMYKISYYDEEGYAALRMAQRNNEQSEHKPLFTVNLSHRAAGREGLWVQTEFIAVTAALLIWWFATVTKNKMQE